MQLVLGATIGLVFLVVIVFGGALGALSSGQNAPTCQVGAPSEPEQGRQPDLCASSVPLPAGNVPAKVITYAHAQLGTPYAWGHEGPNSFDCSGLTWAAYQSAEITIPRVAADQWQRTPHVPRGQEKPGDLAFFNSGPGTAPDRPGHVGIVIGDGKMIAAPHTGTVVQVQPYARQSLIGFTRPSAIRQLVTGARD